jgi:hypothetical protein
VWVFILTFKYSKVYYYNKIDSNLKLWYPNLFVNKNINIWQMKYIQK